ncbi:MAG: hypothetical protein Q8880_12320, partial [Bacteroidota bacterium]|nr:hypothetical protein [Bacteroidota bacterium]
IKMENSVKKCIRAALGQLIEYSNYHNSNKAVKLVLVSDAIPEKADKECKFRLKVEDFELEEVLTFNMTPADKREIKKIIYEHFDYIVSEWNRFFKN